MKKHILYILLIAIGVKIIYFVFAELVSINNPFPNIDASSFFDHNKKHGLINITALNDGQWYKGIAEKGQQHVTPEDLMPNIKNGYSYSSYIFFPMYPYTIRFLMKITGLGFVEIGFIFSIVLSLILFIFFYRFSIIILGDEEQAFWATILLIVFPYHFYYSMLYTESMFLVLLLLSFYAIEKKYWFVFIISGSLLVITRAQGIVMGLPLFVYLLEKTKRENIISYQTFFKTSLFSFMLVAYIAYGIYLKYMTGEYFAFTVAAKGWLRPLSFNPVAGLFTENFWRAYVLSAYATIFIILAIFSYQKVRISFLLVILVGIVLPLATCTTNGMPRYISVLFPFMYIFSHKLVKLKYKPLIIVVLFCLQLFSFYFFLTEDYLGY
jgi:Gpi18-like mannosyltransferase